MGKKREKSKKKKKKQELKKIGAQNGIEKVWERNLKSETKKIRKDNKRKVDAGKAIKREKPWKRK